VVHLPPETDQQVNPLLFLDPQTFLFFRRS
jgi:hypothetical protein